MGKFNQIFRDHENKVSSKRVWGAVIIILCAIAFELDGFQFYKVNVALFNSFLFTGAALLGLDTVKAFSKKFGKKND